VVQTPRGLTAVRQQLSQSEFNKPEIDVNNAHDNVARDPHNSAQFRAFSMPINRRGSS
jgi:hypothetical protein